MKKTFELKFAWGGTFKDCFFVFEGFHANGTPDISIYGKLEGEEYPEPICDVTANINVGDNRRMLVPIKSYSENEGLIETLRGIGVIKQEGKGGYSGFVHIPVCLFDWGVFNDYCHHYDNKEKFDEAVGNAMVILEGKK